LVNASTLTITSGANWQTLFPLNSNRQSLWIENPCSSTSQNISAAESLFVSFGSIPSGTSGAFEIAPCGSLVMSDQYISQQIIYVYGATAGHAFVAAQTQ
jgi:hypothetical protein